MNDTTRRRRIALLNPTYWPEVRRGSERLIHDLATALAQRGHQVTLFTSHRGRPTSTVEDGVRVVRSYRPPQPSALRSYEFHLTNGPMVAWHLLRGDFDVAHACFPSDAWAAVGARKLGGPPVVFSMHGLPSREYLVVRRYRLAMLQRVLAESVETTVLSDAASRAVERYLLHQPRVVPGGVFCADFRADVEPAPAPTLVCAASLNDPRKRLDLLLRAFERLRTKRPDARLLLAGADDPILDARPRALPPGVEQVRAERTDVLAATYAKAWASVLPAVGEAFGLVLLESMAAGTPVVAARSGACPEIISGNHLGRLFEPDCEAGLARAMDEALDLRHHAGVAERCRARAEEYDWSRVVALYEDVYENAVGRP